MSNYRHLYQLIEDVFNKDGIRELCMDVSLDTGVDLQFENLAGDTTRRKAQELQEFARRNQITPELLQAIHRAKPRVDLTQFGGPEPNVAAPQNVEPDNGEQGAGQIAPAITPETVYENFDISIRPTGNKNEYLLEAESPYGETADSIRNLFPFDDDNYKYLANMLRDVQASKPKFANELGEMLRRFLFPPQIQEEFSKSLSSARATGKDGLRVRLNINRESNELYQVPWEFCRDDKAFLAVNDDTPLVRYMPTNRPPAPIKVPDTVKILLAWANPKDLVELTGIQNEIDAIQEALKDFTQTGKVVIEILPKATSAELFDRVSKNRPDIFHFIGHGDLDNSGGAIVLEDGGSGHVLLNGDLLLELFQGTNTKLIILSACQTGTMGEKSKKPASAQAFMGLAPKLVWGGLPAVIAMQYDLPDRAARPFMKTLYEFLAMGKPLDWAMTKARLGLRFAILDKPYWGIPVLFMRAPDGNIWA